MAIEPTNRLGLPTYTAGTDVHPVREDFNDRMELLDQLAAIVEEGLHEERGLPQTWGRFWLSTDTRDLYFDRGNEWILVARIGAGGPGEDVVIDGEASEGTSDRAARADHTHSLPLATGSAPGAMSAGDKETLDGATSSVSPDRVVRRDSGGRARFGAPVNASDAATKSYVDGQVSTVEDGVESVEGRLDDMVESRGDLTSGDLNDVPPGFLNVPLSAIDNVSNTPPNDDSPIAVITHPTNWNHVLQEAWARPNGVLSCWRRMASGIYWTPWYEVVLNAP